MTFFHLTGYSQSCSASAIFPSSQEVKFISDLRTNMNVCESVYILLSTDIYHSRSDRSEHIYHEIHGKNYSSAHSRTIFHGRIQIVTTPGSNPTAVKKNRFRTLHILLSE